MTEAAQQDNSSRLAAPSTASAAQKDIDQTFYTWSNFFSILTGSATNHERDAYFHTRDLLYEERDIKRCEEDVKYLFKSSPIITFMKHNIDLLGPADGGASISPKNIICRRCDGKKQGGGFDPEYGILICANEMRSRSHLEDTLAHEMVHAWDHLRFKVNYDNLRHAACMEIRASTLSGECRFTKEFLGRRQWNLTQQLQECVRRRATLSVAARPNCKDDAHAARVVNEVFDSCFRDTRPFDRIYR
jgi:inner membrane protease ATP23